MLTLPLELTALIVAFAPLFSKPVFKHAQVLLVGSLLAPGKRTVTAALRVMGLSGEAHFQNYHRVLNRAAWSALAASRLLLGLLLTAFAPEGVLVLGLDDTIERRRGDRITAKGIYRDPVRSSHSHFVKASGLRWLSLMLLVKIPRAGRVWALPFLTALCPSERYCKERGRAHRKLTDRARQMLLLAARWLPDRELVVTADSSFAALELLGAVREQVTVVTRLRLGAALYEPAPVRAPGRVGRPRKKGKRLPTLAQVAAARAKWQRLTVRGWYGEPEREVEVVSRTCVWYHTGKPSVPIRWGQGRRDGERGRSGGGGVRLVSSGEAFCADQMGAGTASRSERSKWCRGRASGITRGSLRCRSDGCWSETLRGSSTRRPCSRRSSRRSLSKYSNGSSAGGRWK